MNKQYVACSICGDTHYLRDMDAIYRNSWRYYCHKKDCQERFFEDVGNLPDAAISVMRPFTETKKDI